MADRDVEGLLRWSLACMSLASAMIHASAAADHRDLPLHVAFFLVVAAVQSGLAAAVLRGGAGRWVAVTAAFNGAVAVIWVLSRTTGLPVEGAAGAEPLGFKDGISTLLELGIVAGAGLLAILPEAGRRLSVSAGPLASIVIAATVWGLGVSGVLARHTHDDHVPIHGAGVPAVADHHGRPLLATSGHGARDHDGVLVAVHLPQSDHLDHQADERRATTGAGGAGHAGHSHRADVTEGSGAHDDIHAHEALAPEAHHGHELDGTVGNGDAVGQGYDHDHNPEHHPGAGHEPDPGHEPTPGPDRLIADALMLLPGDRP
jgi:hypothetical protein